MIRITKFIARHLYLSAVLGVIAIALLLTAARLLTPTLLAAYADDIA